MGRLAETNNFLDLFCHVAGESEVPQDFIFWAGMSLLASCVADRVWMEPDAGRKVTPNLYVFLLGPSGTGKEYAVHAAGKYAAKEPTINVYGGMATSQFLLKYLARRHKSDHQVWAFVNTKLYFITEELGMCTRPGEQAHDLVTTMTGLYKGAPYPFRKGTVSGDDLMIPNPCLNWLAGSTDDWLVKTIGRDAVMGGFTARLVTVRGRRNYAVRYPQMLFPEDLEEVKAHLEARVRGYTEAEGGLTLSEEARTIHDNWYLTRPAPTDEQNEPGFNKADEMVLRFATLLSLADWDAVAERDAPGIVEAGHMQRAIDLWDNVSAQTPEVIRLASSTVKSSQVDVVSNLCQKAGTIDRSSLTRKARYYGLDGDDIDRCVRTLIAQDSLLMHREPSPRGPARTIYTWQAEDNAILNGYPIANPPATV